jgi:hypothetical protein
MAGAPTSSGSESGLNGQTLLDGFQFLLGELIGNAPLVFPGEQDLFMALELTAEFAQYIPVIGWIISLVAELLVIVLEVIDELVAIFEGVPRAQKTGYVARRFANGKSPVSQLVSAQLYQMLNDEGIVLSSSLPADQARFAAIRGQAELMLTTIGATQADAKSAIDEVWNNTTSGTEAVPHLLNQVLPSQWVIVGPKIIQQEFINHYNKLVGQGLTPKQAGKKATLWILHHAPQAQLVKMRIFPQPGTNPCPPGTVFNPATGKCIGGNVPPNFCPQGQHWDYTLEKCVPDVTTPQTCPPGQIWDVATQTCIPNPASPQPCVPNPDGSGDELTDGLDCVSQNLNVIQQQIAALQQSITGQGDTPADPVTCTQLSGLLSTLNVSIASIATAIAAAAGTAPAVTVNAPVTVNVPAEPPPVVNINAPPPDLTAVVQKLADLFSTIDVPPEIVQQLVAAGYLSQDALATIGQGAFGSVIVTAIVNFFYKALTNFLSAFGVEIVGGKPRYVGLSKSWSDSTAAEFASAIQARDTVVTPAVKALIGAIVADLTPAGGTTIGNVGVDADKPVSDALGITLSAAFVAYLLAFVGIDEGEPLTRLAEIVGGAVGFEELRDVQIGPLIRNGIGKVAEMNARAKFRQELPDYGTLAQWAAMGLLTPARLAQLAGFTGIPSELEPVASASSFRGLNPRQLLRLIETNLFSAADIADELTFSAMRPVSQHRMIVAAPYLATAAERSSLRATIENAAVAGLLADADVTAQLDAAESNTDRDSLVLAKVHLQQLVANAKAIEAEYANLFKVNLITDETFRANLAAIGLQPWAVNKIAATAEVQANVTLQKKTLAAEAALERATENKARQAAMKNFTTGNIDAAGLALALTAAGLTAAQAALWVDLAVLQKAGPLRWLYGLQLTPQQAILLRERVTALTDQRKRLQISDAAYVTALQQLGIHDRYINALRATADAMITPKTSAVVIPVQTN